MCQFEIHLAESINRMTFHSHSTDTVYSARLSQKSAITWVQCEGAVPRLRKHRVFAERCCSVCTCWSCLPFYQGLSIHICFVPMKTPNCHWRHSGNKHPESRLHDLDESVINLRSFHLQFLFDWIGLNRLGSLWFNLLSSCVNHRSNQPKLPPTSPSGPTI